jgi:hypothetical protein
LGLLHCHRVVHPLQFGGAELSDDWSLRDWAGQCHRKGGLVVWTEPFAPKKPFAGEALALAILGEIDAYELSPDFLQHSLRGWYFLLDAGIDLPLVGGSGRYANDRPISALQTVSHWGGPDCDNWFEPIKVGSGKVTNGPVPNFSPGDQIGATFSALSIRPFSRVELLVNGIVVSDADGVPTVDGDETFAACGEYKYPINGWVAARIVDAKPTHLHTAPMFGHTSALRIGELVPKSEAVQALLGHLDRGIDWVENHGRFEQLKFKKQLLDTFAEAKSKLLSGKRS